MAIMRSSLILGCSALLALSACGTPVDKDIEFGGQYWQRASVSDAAYQQGPKAQQMLNRDIGRCVVELRELERLGSIKNAIPADASGRVLDPDDKALRNWDTPERDKNLFAEHTDYHDFESCMWSKGWERVLYVPYDVAEKSRETYLEAHIDYQYQTRIAKERKKKQGRKAGPYENLND